MSSQKKLAAYSSAFQDIIESAIIKPQILYFKTPETAASMRRELYNFRYALRKAIKVNPEMDTLILLAKANRLTFRLRAETLKIGEAYQMNEINNHEQYTLRPRSKLPNPPRQHPDK